MVAQVMFVAMVHPLQCFRSVYVCVCVCVCDENCFLGRHFVFSHIAIVQVSNIHKARLSYIFL